MSIKTSATQTGSCSVKGTMQKLKASRICEVVSVTVINQCEERPQSYMMSHLTGDVTANHLHLHHHIKTSEMCLIYSVSHDVYSSKE